MRYDYRCDECEEIFEVEHGLGKRKHDLTCPTCGAIVVQRVITRAPAIGIHWRSPRASHNAMGMNKFLSSVPNRHLGG